jgi:hypothetical protein
MAVVGFRAFVCVCARVRLCLRMLRMRIMLAHAYVRVNAQLARGGVLQESLAGVL